MAAAILRGHGIWPGIWLGACLGNGSAYADFSTFDATWRTLVAANLNGAGDTLCALVGAYLIRRRVRPQDILARIDGITAFIFFGAVLGSVISATLGVGGLCLGGILPWQEFLYTWATWTVGDGVGILVVTPLILVVYFRAATAPSGRSTSAKVEAITVVSAVLAATLGGMVWIEDTHLPHEWLMYFIVLATLGCSFRYGLFVSILLVSGISLLAIVATTQGTGHFVESSLNESLFICKRSLAFRLR